MAEGHALEDHGRADASDSLSSTTDRSSPLNESGKSENARLPPHAVAVGLRGLRLTSGEEMRLVKICRARMISCEASLYRRSSWVSVATLFTRESGRQYSWQSCKRRVSDYVAYMRACRAAFDAGLPLPSSRTYKHESVCIEVDKWLDECDARVRKDKTRAEQLRDLREKTDRELEDRRSRNFKRVQEWIDNLEDPRDILDRLQGNNSNSNNVNDKCSAIRRSRSRSPHRSKDQGNNRYRQRSPQSSASRILGEHENRKDACQQPNKEMPADATRENSSISGDGEIAACELAEWLGANDFVTKFFIETVEEVFTNATATMDKRIDQFAREFKDASPDAVLIRATKENFRRLCTYISDEFASVVGPSRHRGLSAISKDAGP